jgi:hypothetical protein
MALALSSNGTVAPNHFVNVPFCQLAVLSTPIKVFSKRARHKIYYRMRLAYLGKGAMSGGRHDTQHNDIQHYDTRHKGFIGETQHK